MKFLPSLGGAILFYTCFPLPPHWPVTFERIARWCPLLGGLLGGVLAGLVAVLTLWHWPTEVIAVWTVIFWVYGTGGLHLDGAADTADGLQIQDPERRLAVMKDSYTGAFGVIAITLILLSKTLALLALLPQKQALGWLLSLTLAWARWGQVVAIAAYPYLRTQGKGAIHRQTLHLPADLLLGLVVIAGISGLGMLAAPPQRLLILEVTLAGAIIAPGLAGWFAWRLGGHTGDSYGAVVEWSEAILLAVCSGLGANQ